MKNNLLAHTSLCFLTFSMPLVYAQEVQIHSVNTIGLNQPQITLAKPIKVVGRVLTNPEIDYWSYERETGFEIGIPFCLPDETSYAWTRFGYEEHECWNEQKGQNEPHCYRGERTKFTKKRAYRWPSWDLDGVIIDYYDYCKDQQGLIKFFCYLAPIREYTELRPIKDVNVGIFNAFLAVCSNSGNSSDRVESYVAVTSCGGEPNSYVPVARVEGMAGESPDSLTNVSGRVFYSAHNFDRTTIFYHGKTIEDGTEDGVDEGIRDGDILLVVQWLEDVIDSNGNQHPWQWVDKEKFTLPKPTYGSNVIGRGENGLLGYEVFIDNVPSGTLVRFEVRARVGKRRFDWIAFNLHELRMFGAKCYANGLTADCVE